MVHFARLLTAAALVTVSVAAPMKARTNDNSYQQSSDSSSQQGGDSSYQQGSDSSYQQGSDSSYQPPSDSSYQQGSDNSYQPPSDNSYQQGSDNSYQSSSYDSSYQPSSYDNSYQSSSSDSSYQPSSYDNSYQSSSADNSYQSSSVDNSYQSSSYDNSYQSSSYDNSNYQTTSSYDNSYQTMTTSSDNAYSTPSYGSGSQSWGSGYNDCVMQCAASYGMASGMYSPPTQTASDSSMYGGSTGSNGVTHTIVVAPSPSVYRYMPFSTNASIGDTVEFYWANGEHTVTSSSAVELCTKNDQGDLDSGKNQAGFQYSTVIKDQNPQWFYCGVADHCKQGMFGGININQANPDGGQYTPLSSVASNMTSGNSDMAAMWQYTKKQTGDNAYANAWGMNINVAGMDDTTMAETMKNVMWTQTLIAANPNAVDPAKGFQVTTQNMTIPGDIGKLLATAPDPSSASSNPAASSGSASSPTSGGVSAASTSAGATKNGAASVASSSIATVFVAVAACFFLL